MSKIKFAYLSMTFWLFGWAWLAASCTPEPPLTCPDDYKEEQNKPCVAAPAPIYHPGKMSYGRVAGLKNCRPFMASATAGIGNPGFPNLGLAINTYEDWDGFYAHKEMIRIVAITLDTGRSPIITHVDTLPGIGFSSYSTVQDHDVFEDLVDLDTTYNNFFHFTKVDTFSRLIQGWFQARFILSTPPSDLHPDTVIFTHCYFEARTL